MEHQAGKSVPTGATGAAILTSNGGTFEVMPSDHIDATINVAKVEQRFTSSLNMTADTQVKAGEGFLHTVTFACADAAPTAGTVIVYDNTAESGDVLLSVGFTTTWFAPCTVVLDVPFATGLYVGFTTTADVNVVVSYR
jgi:hypothetical protein